MSCEKFAAECMEVKRLTYLVSAESKLDRFRIIRSSLHYGSDIRPVIIWSARVGFV